MGILVLLSTCAVFGAWAWFTWTPITNWILSFHALVLVLFAPPGLAAVLFFALFAISEIIDSVDHLACDSILEMIIRSIINGSLLYFAVMGGYILDVMEQSRFLPLIALSLLLWVALLIVLVRVVMSKAEKSIPQATYLK